MTLQDGQGKVLRFVGTSTDIEDLKRSQENLQRTEERTRLIVDTALDAVITMDVQGAITSWNKQAEVVFGWSNREAISQHMSEMIIPERQRADHERCLRHYPLGALVSPSLATILTKSARESAFIFCMACAR